jgi:hypothetical protein
MKYLLLGLFLSVSVCAWAGGGCASEGPNGAIATDTAFLPTGLNGTSVTCADLRVPTKDHCSVRRSA